MKIYFAYNSPDGSPYSSWEECPHTKGDRC